MPDKNKQINFWLINKDISQLEVKDKEAIINSVVLGEEIDTEIAYIRHMIFRCLNILKWY